MKMANNKRERFNEQQGAQSESQKTQLEKIDLTVFGGTFDLDGVARGSGRFQEACQALGPVQRRVVLEFEITRDGRGILCGLGRPVVGSLCLGVPEALAHQATPLIRPVCAAHSSGCLAFFPAGPSKQTTLNGQQIENGATNY